MMAYYVLLQSTWEEKLSFCPRRTTATASKQRLIGPFHGARTKDAVGSLVALVRLSPK